MLCIARASQDAQCCAKRVPVTMPYVEPLLITCTL